MLLLDGRRSARATEGGRVHLQVAVDGSTPYPVTHRQVLAMVALPGFQPGASVPVRVDPNDQQSLIIA